MKAGVIISVVAHALLLAWGVISFAAKPLEAKPTESLPVDIISDKDFSQITQGQEKAKQQEKPKPLVEKEAEKKPVKDPTPKVSEKKEILPAAESIPVPTPAPTKAEMRPNSTPEQKPDPIAEALKKDEAKPQPAPKQAEAKPVPSPVKKPPIPVPPKFDPMKIAALLNKQEPQRQAATGDRINHNVSLGLASGSATQLSQSELDALLARLKQLWNPPAGAKNPEDLVVVIRIQLKRDGTLAAPPLVITSGKDPLFVAARDSAARALFRGQPYDMLRKETYDLWKDMEIRFDPRDMFRG